MPWFYTGAYNIDCSSITGCINTDIFNFGQLYFTDFLRSLTYMVYDKAITITIQLSTCKSIALS